MKTIKLILILSAIFLTFFSGCVLTVNLNEVPGTQPSVPLIQIIFATVFSAYEILVRVVPSVKDYSVISLAINILKKISDSLNIRSPDR